MKLDKSGTSFANPSFAGNTDPPGSVPSPDQNKGDPKCRIPFLCPRNGRN